MASTRAAYDRSNAQLYGAFKYPTLSNEDAVILVGLIDDCVYKSLKCVDAHTDWVRRQYARFAVGSIFKDLKKAYSSVNDSLVFTELPVLVGDDWLDRVRNDVNLYRGHWIKALRSFIQQYGDYQFLCMSDSPADKRQAAAIELDLDANDRSLYGVIAEVKHNLARISKILERMVRPYLRKLVSLAKTFAREPTAFFENYQNGYHGILSAIGRYDVRIGAYAFIVDMWIKSYMVSGISTASNTIKMPSRIWKHRRLLEKHSNMEVEQIAKKHGIDPSLLQDSARLLDVRNAMPIIEESDEQADNLEDYHDRRHEQEHEISQLRQQLETYSRSLAPHDRLVLSIAFDIDLHTSEIPKADLDREAARQLFACHISSQRLTL